MHAVGRYVIFGEIGSGGMATVHLARLVGPAGFSRTVAVKRLHPHLAKDPEFVSMFLDEARLAARIRHPNVVPTIDVVTSRDEVLVVLEYVHGEPLAQLIRASIERGQLVSPSIAASVLGDVLLGLHAAHMTTDSAGRSLEVVHRDVSPQNVLVGAEGMARLLDFGVARALGRSRQTEGGKIKGKLAYMAPEQLDGIVSPKTDIYAASVVLWEMLAGRRLFVAEEQGQLIAKVAAGARSPPPGVPKTVADVVMRGLAMDPKMRFESAHDMALALRASTRPASTSEVGAWVESLAREGLSARAAQLRAIERGEAPERTRPEATAPVMRGRNDSHMTATMEVHASAAVLEELMSSVGRPAADGALAAPPMPVESPRAAPRRARRRLWIAGATLTAAVFVAGVVWQMIVRPTAAPTDGESAGIASFVAAPNESSSPAPSSEPAMSASSALAGTAPPAAARTKDPRRRVPRRSSKPDCNPPYEEVLVGSHKRRIPKEECL